MVLMITCGAKLQNYKMIQIICSLDPIHNQFQKNLYFPFHQLWYFLIRLFICHCFCFSSKIMFRKVVVFSIRFRNWFLDPVNKIINSIYFYCSRLSRQNSLPSLNERKVSAPPPSTSHSGSTLGGGGTGNGGGLRRSTVVARSPSSAKEVILSWVQERTNTYPVIIQKIQ